VPKVRVTITIDEAVLERVDSTRGSTSRSEYIERVLAEHLGLTTTHAGAPEKRSADGSLEVLREMLKELREIRRLLSEGSTAAKKPEEAPVDEGSLKAEEQASLPASPSTTLGWRCWGRGAPSLALKTAYLKPLLSSNSTSKFLASSSSTFL